MDGIVLDRAEFLVLLDATRTSAVIGLEHSELFPGSLEELRALLTEGRAAFIERGLLRQEAENVMVMDPELGTMALTLSRPLLSSITVRQLPELGEQLFLHYATPTMVVEQTLPEVGKHRLATLPNLEQLVLRLMDIVPISISTQVGTTFSLPLDVFFEAKQLIESKQVTQAEQILQPYSSAEAIQLLITAIRDPQISGTMALLRCGDREIIDGRNPAILQGPTSAWWIAQASAGQPLLRLESIDQERYQQLLQECITELIETSNTLS